MKRAIWGFCFGLILCLLLAGAAGENPLLVAKVLFKSAFGSWEDLALSAYYTSSLIFTGLSVCVAFQAGLFNIGAEGQLVMATMTTTGVGLWLASHFSTTSTAFGFVQSLVAAGAGLVIGAFWGFVPGYLKVKRQAHEVILTMMMNFIAAGLAASFVVAHQNPDSQNPESSVLPAKMGWASWDPLHQLLPETPFNISFLLALACAFLLAYFLKHSRWGFELRATGQAPAAAALNGISTTKVQMRAMLIAGALAGGVALNEVLGSQMKYRLGFSPDYGFMGIAVALLARNNPLGVLVSAFLFGALQKGAGELDLETTYITRDFARILQAVLILSVSAFALWPDSFQIKNHFKKRIRRD